MLLASLRSAHAKGVEIAVLRQAPAATSLYRPLVGRVMLALTRTCFGAVDRVPRCAGSRSTVCAPTAAAATRDDGTNGRLWLVTLDMDGLLAHDRDAAGRCGAGHGARGVEEPKITRQGSGATMRAVRLRTPEGAAGLVLEELDTPAPGAGEVLVRVHAAAITRNELDWPVDRLPATPSYELSGVVAALGPDVDGFQVGEAVYALTGFDRDGAAADYAVVPGAFLAPKPGTLGHVVSAAIPLAALSAWQGLFDHGRLAGGQRVLVHGAAGGVGGFAVQLAHWRGAVVIGTASTANVEAARQLGADQVIDHASARFEDLVEPVDLVFDTAGGDRLERSPAVVRPGGRLVSIASEPPAEAAAGRGIAAVHFVVEPNGKQLVELARLADRGDLRVSIDEVFPLSAARAAFEHVQGRHGAGKVVLRVAEQDS
jgi:NADPH:quinone reductase-like Zn-dependent oxidoreductase